MSKIKSQEKFYAFLKEKQRSKIHFTQEDVISATGWKPSTSRHILGRVK